MFPGTERNVANTNSIGQLLRALPTEIRKIVRQIENTQQKFNNAEVAVSFNFVCLKEEKKEYIYMCVYIVISAFTLTLI